jgi:hypothetical protein
MTDTITSQNIDLSSWGILYSLATDTIVKHTIVTNYGKNYSLTFLWHDTDRIDNEKNYGRLHTQRQQSDLINLKNETQRDGQALTDTEIDSKLIS